jgi:hypothetical protein
LASFQETFIATSELATVSNVNSRFRVEAQVGPRPGRIAARIVRKREIFGVPHFITIHRRLLAYRVFEDPMIFIIHGWKEGQNIATARISAAAAIDKARALEGLGWTVRVTDTVGHRFEPPDFDQLPISTHADASRILP